MENQNINNVETTEITGKLIFSQRVAKNLIALGEKITDIEPNNKEKSKSVFVFAVSPTLSTSIEKATKREEVDTRFRVVSSAGVARHLIRDGFEVKDLRPDRTDKNRTVFVFERTGELEKKISEAEIELKKMSALSAADDEKVLKVTA